MRKGAFVKLLCVLSVITFSSVTLFGCASRHVDADYAAYTEAYKAFATKEQKPLVDVTIGTDGKIRGFKLYERQPMPRIAQRQPSPMWGLASKALGVAGVATSIWLGGKALENIVDSVASHSGGNIAIGDNNSWQAGKDVNAAYGGGINVEGNTTYSSPFNDSSEQCCPELGTGTGTGTGTETSIFEAPIFE